MYIYTYEKFLNGFLNGSGSKTNVLETLAVDIWAGYLGWVQGRSTSPSRLRGASATFFCPICIQGLPQRSL